MKILTERGQKQALALVRPLSRLEIEVIFSSPYERAIATVEPFARKAGIPIQIEPDLRERKVSEGLVDNYLGILEKSWWDFDFKFPRCESARECQTRVTGALNEIVAKHAGKRILVSSHGNAIALILHYFDSSFGFEDWQSLHNPDLVEIVFSAQKAFWNREFKLELAHPDSVV